MYEVFSKLLQERNVTAYKVAKETGVLQSTLSSWKTGRSDPSKENLMKIAAYFGVSIDYLMTGEETEDEIYYLDAESRELAKEAYKNQDIKLLFQAARNVKPDDLKYLIELAQRFKDKT